ncbi:hypothetical protein OsJ_22649 [Oryza sativa Japonica Group]|uniref:Uncharacterized protein n=1 Tax=Oryza sativa subsp. japonica TaxID=39947 RepID=B9FQW3_ORYSJ|nr:hypothetical protein OsJ_22649 [Oryza sativa Japonica Group]
MVFSLTLDGCALAEEAAVIGVGGGLVGGGRDAAEGVHGGEGGGARRRGRRRRRTEGERFVVPVGYLKHPLFVGLLKEAEEEFGFEQKGAITIPCGVDHFRRVQGIIHHQKHHHGGSHGAGGAGAGGLLSGHGSSGHHNNFHIAACFRA